MSSLTRMLGLLDLFDTERPFWTSEQIMEATGYTRPTTFRYLKVLRDAGFLARFGGGYTLGGKAAKLDYVIRQSDPLVKLFDPIMSQLRDHIGCEIILVSLLGDEFFATIHKERIGNSAEQSWPRGRPMPLHKGAGGIAVLSAMPKAQLKRMLKSPKIEAASVDVEELLKEIEAAGKQGYAISYGAIDPGNVGIAVPIVLNGVPPAALLIAMEKHRYATADVSILVGLLQKARREMVAVFNAYQIQLEGRSGGADTSTFNSLATASADTQLN
ncbi:helix-turn-helix domain-containing protein (plasmid) [Cupriavidus necator]|uniref:ArsR family transcriptional regulator n=1 Tax=Cupriavidus necator TaxID=106590 RepID=A0A367P8C1_CUPNE|nr:IclR family transcriptional regulator C-terminal domain-containing protein [Cupriavidus necator]QQX89552.1 helix-turn-helix domain-containing protein [Cupriavidus necator]RCJ04089.1 ArsR family transcriptional regulator [Cupriavidus necator]